MGFFWEYIYYRIFESSGLTDFEYISLVSNYHVTEKDDERSALESRGYKKEQIDYILKKKPKESFRSLNIEFSNKTRLRYEYFLYCLILHDNYKRGILPFPGSMSDQPNKIIEIFLVLDQLQQEAEEKMRKKIQKENKKNG